MATAEGSLQKLNRLAFFMASLCRGCHPRQNLVLKSYCDVDHLRPRENPVDEEEDLTLPFPDTSGGRRPALLSYTESQQLKTIPAHDLITPPAVIKRNLGL